MNLSVSSTYRSLFSQSSCFLPIKQIVFASTSTKSHEDRSYKYDVPKYTKVNAWDKDSKELKVLRKILSSKRNRTESDSVVLEGVRMIKEALSLGHTPSVLVFSREKLLHQLEFGGHRSSKLMIMMMMMMMMIMQVQQAVSPSLHQHQDVVRPEHQPRHHGRVQQAGAGARRRGSLPCQVRYYTRYINTTSSVIILYPPPLSAPP